MQLHIVFLKNQLVSLSALKLSAAVASFVTLISKSMGRLGDLG
jgi:hypothetical protein